MEAFKDIRDRAVMAVPEIRDQIDQAIEGAREANQVLAKGLMESAEKVKTVIITGAEDFESNVARTNGALLEASQTTASSSEEIKKQFSTALEDINNHTRNLIAELQLGAKELNKNYQATSGVLMDETSKASKVFASGLDEMRRRLETTISQQAEEHRQQADRVFHGLERSIESALSRTGESVQKQVHMLDQTMGEEISKVMQSMGNALASISGQFTNDYKRLVNQMHNIVRMGAGAD